jgi:hypothetical protein
LLPNRKKLEKLFNAENNTFDKLSNDFVSNVKSTLRKVENNLKKLLVEYSGKTSQAVDIEFALEAKTQLQALLRDAGYYTAVDDAVGKYSTVIKSVKDTYGAFGANVKFTDIDRRAITEFIQTDLGEFADLGRDIQRQIYKSLTDSALGGISVPESVTAIEAALANTDIAKHAYTIINTAYLQFNARVNNIAAENTGWKQAIYMGPIDNVTRDFCRAHINQIMTIDEAKKLQNDQGMSAWSSVGGWNCRHRWVAVPPSYEGSQEYAELEKRTDKDLAATK